MPICSGIRMMGSPARNPIRISPTPCPNCSREVREGLPPSSLFGGRARRWKWYVHISTLANIDSQAFYTHACDPQNHCPLTVRCIYNFVPLSCLRVLPRWVKMSCDLTAWPDFQKWLGSLNKARIRDFFVIIEKAIWWDVGMYLSNDSICGEAEVVEKQGRLEFAVKRNDVFRFCLDFWGWQMTRLERSVIIFCHRGVRFTLARKVIGNKKYASRYYFQMGSRVFWPNAYK